MLKGIIVAGGTVFPVGNLVLPTNYGYQEALYRAEVGRFIAAHAEEGDTLFLEPAGYIPFYANLKTWDKVGLCSPDILTHRRPGNEDWWIEFVRDKRPNWIVEREPIHRAGSPDGSVAEGFNGQDRQWFGREYQFVRHFIYSDYIAADRSIMTPVYQLGSHSDYFVYQLR